MDELPFRSVAILGLGVIGGSLALALSRRGGVRIVGWSPAMGERSKALESGAVADAPSAWEEAVEEADLVVLAMPLDACLTVLPELDGLAPPAATLTDVASLKLPLVRAARAAGLSDRWVGGHPMAGSEGSGFERADGSMFQGARVWLVADEEASGRVGAVDALWRGVGALPRTVEAGEHDRLMGLVSHVPQLLANALGAELAHRGVTVASLGPGGRDMTRLARSQPGMWMDLFRHAPAEAPAALRGVASRAIAAAEALEVGDLEALERLMNTSSAWRGGE